jgi:hypothetical protein
MSAIAIAEPTAAVPAPQSARRERIPARVRDACALLASGECKTVKAAAERVRLSRTHLSRMLGRPHVQMFIEREARRNIAVGTLRASHRVLELVDASSEHVSLDAAKHVLGIANIRPPENGGQVNVNVGVSVGYVLDLREPEPGARVLEHAPVQDAG